MLSADVLAVGVLVGEALAAVVTAEVGDTVMHCLHVSTQSKPRPIGLPTVRTD